MDHEALRAEGCGEPSKKWEVEVTVGVGSADDEAGSAGGEGGLGLV